MADREQQSYNHSYDPQDDERGEQEPYEIQLPEHGGRTAFIVGIVGGPISFLIPLIVMLLFIGLYREAGRLGDNMPYNLALTITLLDCVRLLLNMTVAFVAGFITGRIAIRRSLGFVAGALVGFITEIGNIIANTIPGYPPRLVSSAASTPTPDAGTTAIGYLILLGVIIVFTLVGGLLGRWGAAAATNRHPYYEREE